MFSEVQWSSLVCSWCPPSHERASAAHLALRSFQQLLSDLTHRESSRSVSLSLSTSKQMLNFGGKLGNREKRARPLLANSSFGQFLFWPIPLLANSSFGQFLFWPIPLLANSSFGQFSFGQFLFWPNFVVNRKTTKTKEKLEKKQ